MSQESPDTSADDAARSFSPANAPKGSPFASEPKISIRHIMVWAACVAVYLSAYRTLLIDRMPESNEGAQAIFFGAWGVLGGTYLAGLLLFVVRRIRGRSFPRSGGEILWIIGAVGAVQTLVMHLLFALNGPSTRWWFYEGFQLFAGLFIWLPIYIYAIVRSRGYWRFFFVLLVILSVQWFMLQRVFGSFGPVVVYALFIARMGITGLALAALAILDFRGAARYSWPHWVGILLQLSSNLLWMGYWLIMLITQYLPGSM